MLAQEFVDFAHDLADEVRLISRNYFRQPLQVDAKADMSPVTRADREIEFCMRTRIADAFPDHGILGEEHGSEGVDRDYVWVLDPIDGTKSFITGNPLFGTMISLYHKGQPCLGLVDIPILSERWVGVGRQGAFFNGQPCSTSECRRLSEARIYTTSIDSFSVADRALFDQVSMQALDRRFGGDCYSYGLLASGHIDGVFGASLEPYDFLPLSALITSAGGVMTDWSGASLTMAQTNTRIVAASTPALHAQLLDMLAQA